MAQASYSYHYIFYRILPGKPPFDGSFIFKQVVVIQSLGQKKRGFRPFVLITVKV